MDLKHIGTLECLNNQANALVKLVKHPRELAPVQVLDIIASQPDFIHWIELEGAIWVQQNLKDKVQVNPS